MPIHPLCIEMTPDYQPSSEDIAPASLPRAIEYKIPGPISFLGHQSHTLAQLMRRQATLDPIITRPASIKRKTSSLSSSSAPKKKRTTNRKLIQAQSQQSSTAIDSADASPPAAGTAPLEQILENSSHHDSAPASSLLQLESAPSPRDSPTSSQYDIHGPSSEPERPPSPIQEISNTEKPASSLSYSFAVDEFNVEQGEETSSSQAPSEKIQAKLKDILSLLNREIQDQVKDADLLRDALDSIDQDLPADIRTSLDPVSKLDNHFAAVKQALRNQLVQSDLEQKRAMAKQSVKSLHLQVQSNKELLTGLQTALELKETRKAALEAELKNLLAEIEADKKKIAEIPGLTEKMCKEGSAALNEDKQIKSKLSALAKTQEADKKLLEDISGMVSNTKDVILKFLSV